MSPTALDSSVTLDEVFAIVATKRVPLAPELAGYLALELAEHADPGGGDIDPKSVFVGDEGTVALVRPKRESACGDAETSIRAALARLLDASGSQTPALAAASKRKSGSGLSALTEELEAALIPVNRAAARRALARLAREVRRVTLGVGRAALPSSSDVAPSSRRASSPSYTPAPARVAAAAADTFARDAEPARGAVPDEVLRKAAPQPPPERARGRNLDGRSPPLPEPPTRDFQPSPPSPSQTDVDDLIANFAVTDGGRDAPRTADLKAIAGLEPTPPPPASRIDPTQRSFGDTPGGSNESEVDTLLALGSVPPFESRKALLDERQLPTQPSKLRQSTSRASAPPPKPRGSRLVPFLAVLAIAAGGFAVGALRPKVGAVQRAEAPEPSAQPSARTAPACKGTLIVTDVPARAEVLLRQGQAPVDVDRMPVGARLEFVATAEGYAPKRVVVPAGTPWNESTDGKPRLEVAVQLEKSHAHPGTNDPWPPGEPGSTVGGKGPPGTVHLVATPRGAEIWLLAGIGPEARVEQVSCTEDIDVLVAGPTTYRKRLRVEPTDFDGTSPASPERGRNLDGTSPASPERGREGIARVSAK